MEKVSKFILGNIPELFIMLGMLIILSVIFVCYMSKETHNFSFIPNKYYKIQGELKHDDYDENSFYINEHCEFCYSLFYVRDTTKNYILVDSYNYHPNDRYIKYNLDEYLIINKNTFYNASIINIDKKIYEDNPITKQILLNKKMIEDLEKLFEKNNKILKESNIIY